MQIYNDGYLPITGDMHPTSMGQDFKECWISAWPVIGQAFEEASLGQTRFLENQRVFVDRYGYKEEAFFTFSFSPILDESGGVGGLFHPVIEMTQQTLAERRLNILRAVADNTVNARTADEAFALILECLKAFDLDLPFVLLYSIAANGKEANLKVSVGVEMDTPLAPAKINLEEHSSQSWPFTEVIQNGKAVHVEELGKIFGTFDRGPYTERPEQALVFPVTLHGTAQNNYLLVAGVSSRRSLDEKYRVFFDLLTASITNALTKARAQDDERKKSEALAEIDKAKTVFFSNISHEFRTPLTLMLGSLEELLNKRTGEIAVSDKEAIETSHRNAMRLLRLVNNLLDFSRIEAGKVQAQYQLTDLAKYTTELASNFRSVVENAGLIFQVKTDAVIQPVYIDKEMWEKIVLNLLSNAFKYTLKGSITISLTTENNQVLLKVADTGVGIPEAELPKMFQRFHRVQNVVGRTYEGTGIGLSLVSELVKLHGGEIKVQSTEGEGSAFTVSIPTGKAHLPTQHVFEKELDFTASLSDAFINEATMLIDQPFVTGNGTEDLEVHTDAATVLVVDDNADMRAYIKNLLQKQYHVVTANNGMEALHQVKEHSPQLILSDVMMPVMDGIQLLKAVKENVQTQNIPVILLSARAGEESKIEGYETGADDYLVKPFSAKELLARVGANIKLAQSRRQTETHLKSFFSQAPAAIAIVSGPEHVYTLANSLYQKLSSRTEDQLVGRNIKQVWPEVEGQGIYELFDQVFTSGEPYIAHEFPASFSEDGKTKTGYYDFVAQPIKNNDGDVSDIMIHAFEVTEQIEARQRVEESESRFRTLTQSLPQLIWTAKPDGHCDFFNQNWYDYTGSTPEQSFGDGWAQYLHHQHAQPLFAVWQQCLQTGEPIIFEFQCRAKDGHYEWFYVSGQALRDEVGTITKWIGTLTNIDERKKAEAVLQESETRFRTLAETLPQMIWMRTVDGKIEYASESWERYSGNKDISEAWKAMTHPDDWNVVMTVWEKATSNNSAYRHEVRLKNKEGEYRWHNAAGEPVKDEHGKVVKWIGALTDIHEQKTFAEKLEKLVAERTKELERSNEDLQQFAHVASHDLKEPVRKIMTFGSRLKDEFEGDLPEKAKNYIAKIEGASKRMYSMIDGVLLYSSLGSGEQAVEKVDLNETLRHVETDLEVMIQQKHAVIYKEHLPVIEGSPVLLYQLFYNLVNNALKFSKADAKPLIQIVSKKVKGQNRANDGRSDQESLQISIRDNGIGFDQSQADKIFKSFSRLNPKDKYEGTGLGLALCKKIAERHGGTMMAEGVEGEGATFTIVLPVKES